MIVGHRWITQNHTTILFYISMLLIYYALIIPTQANTSILLSLFDFNMVKETIVWGHHWMKTIVLNLLGWLHQWSTLIGSYYFVIRIGYRWTDQSHNSHYSMLIFITFALAYWFIYSESGLNSILQLHSFYYFPANQGHQYLEVISTQHYPLCFDPQT